MRRPAPSACIPQREKSQLTWARPRPPALWCTAKRLLAQEAAPLPGEVSGGCWTLVAVPCSPQGGAGAMSGHSRLGVLASAAESGKPCSDGLLQLCVLEGAARRPRRGPSRSLLTAVAAAAPARRWVWACRTRALCLPAAFWIPTSDWNAACHGGRPAGSSWRPRAPTRRHLKRGSRPAGRSGGKMRPLPRPTMLRAPTNLDAPPRSPPPQASRRQRPPAAAPLPRPRRRPALRLLLLRRCLQKSGCSRWTPSPACKTASTRLSWPTKGPPRSRRWVPLRCGALLCIAMPLCGCCCGSCCGAGGVGQGGRCARGHTVPAGRASRKHVRRSGPCLPRILRPRLRAGPINAKRTLACAPAPLHPDLRRLPGQRAHRVQARRRLPPHRLQRALEEPNPARALHRGPLPAVGWGHCRAASRYWLRG